MTQTDAPSPADVLQSVFGFPGFRDGQQGVVDRLLERRSVLAIFPTGAGKSMCYQLPALMLDGLTLVVSPLIALMKDQIDFLVSKGVCAARLDSSVEAAEARKTYSDMHNGRLKLLYVAPERLANERFLATLKRLNLSMLAVDEAHCIAEWGHNFRPDYLKLAALARELNVGRVLALTATATPAVAGQIAAAFNITGDDIVRTDFHRPNLNLRVSPVTADERLGLLRERLASRPRGPTIVYVTLQKTAEDVARALADDGLPARCYHAGLGPEERHAVQDWFMGSDESIVTATIAFGMGIDKSDIRYVYHYNLPKTLENYAQEIGRAGRDGGASTCEMLACGDDRITLENFTFGDTPTRPAVASLLREVLSLGERFDLSTYELSGGHDIRPLVVETILTYLELDGLIESTGPFYSEYKFQPTRPSSEILGKFDARRVQFLKQIFAHAEKGKTWFKLDVIRVSNATGEPREKVVAALNYLEEQDDLVLQVAGVRQGFRMKRHVTAEAFETLADALAGRFAEREHRDADRLQQVLTLAEHPGCRTRHLLQYFGEDLSADCGHCDACEGVKIGPVPTAPARALADRDAAMLRDLRAERHKSLATPRQQARFLCGLPSPQASRERLGKHKWFGALARVPFRDVLRFVENHATGG